jgi:hypothetical protein
MKRITIILGILIKQLHPAMKKVNPNLLFTCFVIAVLFSCEKDNLSNNTCNVKNPLKDLEWIRNDISFIEQLSPEESQYIAIIMATYNGETVFYSTYCDPTMEPVYPIHNCAGEIIGYWGEIPDEELKDQQVIWKSANCICIL